MTIYCVISVVLVIQTYGDLIKTIRRQTVIVEETNCLMIHCSIDIQLFNVSILKHAGYLADLLIHTIYPYLEINQLEAGNFLSYPLVVQLINAFSI